MDDTLTLFYMKNSGLVKCLCSGKQTLNFYGAEKADVEPFMDYIYVKFNQFLVENHRKFKVVNGEVKLIENPEIEVIKE